MRRRETIEEHMARATQNEKPPAVRTSVSSRGIRVRSRAQILALSACGLAVLWALMMLTTGGQKMYAMGFFFTEFFAGVVALVALSITVMLGLVSTDRLVLMIRHRVLMQSAHRATGILGVAGLGFHVITKIASGRAGVTDAAVPFVGGRGLYVGLGTIAALLMVGVLWTGIIRARFADIGPKWVWRALHSMAYVSWPFAIFHGLLAGRAPAGWVTLSYFLCVVLVVVALLVRLSVTLQRRSREQHQAAALNEAMTGKGSDETRSRSLLATLTRRGGENERARRDISWADSTSGTWASPTIRRNDPERFTVPVVPEPGSLRDQLRPGRTRRDEELEPVVRRASRRDEEELERVVRRETEMLEPVARRRRDDEPVGRRTSRRDEELELDWRSARVEDDLEPVSRRTRRDEEPSWRRASRREEEREPVSRRSTRRREEEELLLDADREPVGRRRRDDEEFRSRRSRVATDARSRYSAPPQRVNDEAEEPWDSPRRWESIAPVSADPVSGAPISGSPISAAPRSGGGRHSAEDDVPEAETDYWRPPARYTPDDVPDDDTPTLVDLASRRARRASSAESRRRRRADPDSVDGAYWAGLRGEAK
ncbi:hypothetical protein Vqi01_07580 [Micromonospora qiuiae]|uniref:Uncharacterized protein n=1 Tax=Micromonospora qiuiae TaxID=502268 RepID=A0ABQ4J6D9_9ACTN|nr:ferric reductase-like transmembrane domain-containing protein [Micromonospora qiuiae]GIJ25596.1 hypothetical protein Vqi01_07580 [Micromonospora qiuiae]